jgi:hypothetical protein
MTGRVGALSLLASLLWAAVANAHEPQESAPPDEGDASAEGADPAAAQPL